MCKYKMKYKSYSSVENSTKLKFIKGLFVDIRYSKKHWEHNCHTIKLCPSKTN